MDEKSSYLDGRLVFFVEWKFVVVKVYTANHP